MAKSVKESESVHQYLGLADAELERIAHITRQSLGFYRESNAPVLMSINAVLESSVDLLKNRIVYSGLAHGPRNRVRGSEADFPC